MQGSQEAAVAVPADIAARWRVCLHEAGHAVAGRVLFKCTTRAAVFSNASGVADVGRGGGVPASFTEALATAAGKAAESMADAYAAPQVPLPVPLETAYPEVVGPLLARLPNLMTDDIAIARWCIQDRESEPNLWERRHDWVRDAAEDFVAGHRQEIVEVGSGLFARGIVRLEAEQVCPESAEAPPQMSQRRSS